MTKIDLAVYYSYVLSRNFKPKVPGPMKHLFFLTGIMSLFCLLLVVSLFEMSKADTGDVYDLIFTGCPPYVEGYYCDSIIYQVAAYEPDSSGPYQGATYFLVEGRGEIDGLTGIWKYKPYLDPEPTSYFEVEIGAELHGDTIPSPYNCRFPVNVFSPPLEPESVTGAHLSVLPFDTLRIPVGVEFLSSCEVPLAVDWSVNPEPFGQLWYDDVEEDMVFVPGFYDALSSYTLNVNFEGAIIHRYHVFYLDVFRHDPTVLRIDTVYERRPGDTVSVDVTLEECPFDVGVISLTAAYDLGQLRLIDVDSGQAFFGESGCGWYRLTRYLHSPYQGWQSVEIHAQAKRSPYDTVLCHTPPLPAVFATLSFEVLEQPDEYEEAFAPVKFYWRYDYRETQLTDSTRNKAYLCDRVYNHNGELLEPEEIPGFAPTSMDYYLGRGIGRERYRTLQLHNGGVHIRPLPEPAPYQVALGYVYDAIGGQFVDLPIMLNGIDFESGLGGFDLRVGYDQGPLSFQQALQGDLYAECGWEYFTYRFGADGNCGGGCPSGLVRVVGLAETNNGSHHPEQSCQVTNPGWVGDLPTTLAWLRFQLSSDPNYRCTFIPVSFFWIDCGDNSLSNHGGYELYISSNVYEFGEEYPISSPDSSFPNWTGALESCLTDHLPGRPYPTRRIDFHNGGVSVVCSGIVTNDIGDLNLNGLAYEIADANIFANYFIYGLSVFPDPERSTVASDVNYNEVPLELADFLYLMRVISGNALPPTSPDTTSNPAYVNVHSSGVVELVCADSLGGVLLSFDGRIIVEEEVEGYSTSCHYDGLVDRTIVLVLATAEEVGIESGLLLKVIGSGELDHVEASTYFGWPVTAFIGSPTEVDDELAGLPVDFALSQNYPNPFNPTTTIEFALPTASAVEVSVFNIVGQRVKALVSQFTPAGYHEVIWDGTNDQGEAVGSGVYFYRIEAGEFVQSRKMMLLK